MPLNLIPIDSLNDPRLADYRGVKERQLAAEFGAPGLAGTPDAPHGKFYVEGDKVLAHLVRSPFRPLSVLCTPTRHEAARADLDQMDPLTPIYLAPQALMDDVIGFNIHRGLLAVAARNPPKPLTALLAETAAHPGPLVVCEDLSNHDNIGAIFRNAGAFGAAGVILSPRSADPLYRKSLRVSMGLALRVPFAVAEPWPAALGQVRSAGYRLLAMTPAGSDGLRLVIGRLGGAKAALLIGAEGPGLTEGAMGMADERVAIPMAQGVDSLNAAVASAVCLYELANRPK